MAVNIHVAMKDANDLDELTACHYDALRLSEFVPRVDERSAEYRRLLALPHDELRRLHAERLGLLLEGDNVRV